MILYLCKLTLLYEKGVLSALFWLFRIWQIHKFQNIATQDAHWYVKCTRIVRAFVHAAWASVLLFGLEGNTRASSSGTARLQSRFFVCVYIPSRLPRHSTDPILSR